MSDSFQLYELKLTRLLCAWDSPGKNTGVGFHALLQGDLPGPGIKPVSPKGNQPRMFIGRTDVEAEAPIFWLPNVKSQLIEKDPDARKD